MQFAKAFMEEPAGHLREPVINTGEDAHDRTTEEHVVDMSDHEVRVLVLRVDGRGSMHHTGDAANSESDDEANGEEHRRREPDAATVQRADPVENLDACGDGDDHRVRGERRVRGTVPMPVVNMWWAHTAQPKNAIATPANTTAG